MIAARDGTGWPSPSLCVGACEVEKPMAPAASALVQQRDHLRRPAPGMRLAADRVLAHHRHGAAPSDRTGSRR